MGIASDIAEKLNSLPESSAVALKMNAEVYFDTIRGVLDNFALKKGLDCIYITSTIPSQSIINALQVLEINLSKVYFVDCISHMMMGAGIKLERVHYVESPTMLETIMLKVEYLMREVKEGNKVVLLDSINSLAIHNSIRILSEFLHILVNNLRSKNAYTIILSVEEYGSEEITNMMNLVCDETIAIEARE